MTNERLLAEYLVAEQPPRQAADALLDETLSAWTDFQDRHGSFADEHSTL